MTDPGSSAPVTGAAMTGDPSCHAVTLACPRCGAGLGAAQDWCLECGAAARTRIGRTTAWHVPVAVVAVIGALCLAALAFAFLRLANTDDDVRAAKAATPAAAVPATTQPAVQPSTFGTTGPTGATGATGPTTPTTSARRKGARGQK